MSYWAATVLTSIVQRVPVIGGVLYRYVVGGYSVTNVTLVRVFSAHVCLGFVILGLMVLHLYYLHQSGSKDPLFSNKSYQDVVYFHSFFTSKDFFCLVVLTFFMLVGLFYVPDLVLDLESYLEADPLVTPASIKPEWYFLCYYSMLRSVDSKIGGLALMLAFIFFLWVPTRKSSCAYFVGRQLLYWLFVSLFFLLTYLGSCHPEYPYLFICKFSRLAIVALSFGFKLFWGYRRYTFLR